MTMGARSRKRRRAQATEVAMPPTQERYDKQDVELKHGRYFVEPVLDRLESRNLINRREWTAGDKYRVHWYHGGLHGQICAQDLNRLHLAVFPNFDGLAKTEGQVFHRQQLWAANKALGPMCDDAVRLIGLDWSPEQIGALDGWNNRAQAFSSGITRIRVILERLSEHWGT